MEPRLLPRTINARQMRQVNRSAILELIRQFNPIARSEISRLLELSMPTIIRIVDELIADGSVRSTGETAGEAGRPRELLEYNKSGGAVIGIDLGGTKLYGALANIGGEILGEVYKSQHASSGEESFALVIDMVQSLIQLTNEKQQKLLGIAVGAPGITHVKAGVVEWAPSLSWRDFPLKQRIADRFHLPVVVDNDVNLAVLGEQWFGAGKGVNNLVLLAIGTGMGAGIVIDGVIYRGHTESAGEVGYFLPGINALGQRYDQFGAMESIVSGTGIAERAKRSLYGSRTEVELEALTASDVFDAARKGESWAVQIVDETADYLSMVIGDIATFLDPELVVLSGGVSNSTDLLIPPILTRLDGVIQHIPRLEVSTLGAKATAMGAISLILHLTKDYYVVRRLH
ncbi:MAG TPA: ROK family protein [Anaerolineales bacterium]|nr:ROK family protein [Anaerolineales bacterium]